MPSWYSSHTLYKGLVSIILALIVLEYFFGSIIETRKFNSLFRQHNNTRPNIELNSPLIHSPMIKSLTSANKPTTNKSLPITSQSTVQSRQTDIFSTEYNTTSSMDIVEGTGVTIVNPALPVDTAVPICPDIPQNLLGKVHMDLKHVPSVPELESRLSWLLPGGHGRPQDCRCNQSVAIVVPYRCRAEHLLLFLQHMHPFLRRQHVDYTIFIVEQAGDGPFNRAMLMNVGYVEALKAHPFDCFIFHDIDLLPEDDRNLYTCPEQPRHMSVAVDIFKYKLPYNGIFGGVSAISTPHFKQLNGFSNLFWGWGGEDDDMANRIRYHNFHISRYPHTIARYTMLTHKKEKASPRRYEILKEGKKKYESEGLSDLRYVVISHKDHILYTWLLVEIHPPS